MPKKPSVKTTAVIPQQPNLSNKPARTPQYASGNNPEARKAKLMPSMTVETRTSPYMKMMVDPVNSPPALPPIALPARAIPVKLYQEVLLSTDASGAAALSVYPLMNALYQTATTITGTTISALNTTVGHSEYINFNTNFNYYVPLVYEVTLQYAGTATASAGRFYGIVAGGDDLNLANFPREPNGCEALTSAGISCCWYATHPVWANPTACVTATTPTEWMDTRMIAGLIGGPASTSNCVTVGIYLHIAAFPRSGIVGLTPLYSTPDPAAQLASELLLADQEGLGRSSSSLDRRAASRRKVKGVIRDVLKVGATSLGTVFPQAGPAVTAAMMLADLIR